MPFYAFGDLKIVASCDIGDLGPKEGTAVNYYWSPLYNVAGTLPWILLVLGFVLFKENRSRPSLLILLPALFAVVLWATYGQVTHESANQKSYYDIAFTSVIVGFTLSGLLSLRLSKIHGFLRFLLPMVLLTAIYGVHQALSLGIDLSAGLIWGIYYFAMCILMVIPALSFARFGCRRKLGFFRFTLLYLLGLTVLDAVAHAFMPLYCKIWSYPMWWIEVRQFFVWWLEMLGLCFVITLPYLIVFFSSPFWRKRFEAVFGLKNSKSPTVESEVSLRQEA